MGTMNVSLPDGLKVFVDEQVAKRSYGTISEYVRELIRKNAESLMRPTSRGRRKCRIPLR